MASVTSSTDGGYRYFSKTVEELENELKTQAEKLNANHEKDVKHLESSYQNDIKKRQADMDTTVADAKEAATRTIATERETQSAEIDRMKRETYDRFGKYNGLEASVVQDQFENFRNDAATEKEKLKENLKQQEEASSKRAELIDKENNKNLVDAARTARDSASESYNKAFRDQRANFDEHKTQSEKRYENLNQDRIKELAFIRRTNETNKQDSELDFNNRVNTLNKSNEHRVNRQQAEFDSKIARQVDTLNKAHAADASALKQQVNTLAGAPDDYKKGRGEGMRDATREYEDEWRQKTNNLISAYDSQLTKLKGQEGQEVNRMEEKNLLNTQQRSKYFGELVHQQQEEAHARLQDVKNQFATGVEELTSSARRDKAYAEQSTQAQMNKANSERGKALESQAKVYQKAMEEQVGSSREKISAMDQALKSEQQKDPLLNISPAVEAAIRGPIEKDFALQMQSESARNKASIESLQQNYSGRMTEKQRESQSKETAIRQNNAFEKAQERNTLLEFVNDVEFNTKTAARDQDIHHNRELDRLQKSYGNSIERQRTQYEEILASQRLESQTKLAGVRQDLEFKHKMAQREFIQTQNQLIQDYEKKITNLKEQQTDEISVIREDAQKLVRETERKTKQEVAEQQRLYEQKISQMEIQAKEKERTLLATHEDQLDKLKKSQAALSKRTKPS